MNARIARRGFYLLIFLCTTGLLTGIAYAMGVPPVSRDVLAPLGLVWFNFALLVWMGERQSRSGDDNSLIFGLLWVTAKLFVNTFTIFLFIGLQAVRTHVFVILFFSAYGMLLLGTIAFLHWNTPKSPSSEPNERPDSS